MRVKILRSLGKNLPAPLPEEADSNTSMDKDGPLEEGQVRDLPDKCCHYLIRNGLAEETTEDVTPKVNAKQPAGTVAAKPSNFNQNPHGPEVKKDK